MQIAAESQPLALQRVPDDEDVARIAMALSDGARRTLATLVLLCPKPLDTTGVSKFSGSERIARGYIRGALTEHNLVGKTIVQERLNIFPTPLAREVHAFIRNNMS